MPFKTTVALMAVVVVAGCRCGDTTGGEGDTGPADVVVTDAGDAAVDTGPTPCDDATEIDLPPVGETMVRSWGSQGNLAVYSEWRRPGQTYMYDVFLFDLVTCEEIPVSTEINMQTLSFLSGNEVIWSDLRHHVTGDVDDWRGELYSYDIGTGIETRLTDTPESKMLAGVHGDHLVYTTSEGTPHDGRFSLELWNRATDAHTLLASYEYGAEGVGIGDRYVSWGAYGAGQGKDVYFYDIQTGVTTYLEETGPGSQTITATAGDYLLFDTEDATGYFHIDQYRYSTGELTRLIDDGYDRRAPRARGNLAVWNDYRYDQSWHITGGMADLVVYDLVTGEIRRITKSSGNYAPGYVQDGWLVYGIGHGGFYYDVRAINLVRLGLVDEFGHVVPE